MRFYHFTSSSHFRLIRASGELNKGSLLQSNGSISENFVWLTTDPNPDRQGLDNFRSESFVEKAQIRIELFIDESDENLISFVNFCSKNEPPLFDRRYALGVAYDIAKLSRSQARTLMFTGDSKEKNWWLYKAPIPSSRFHSVDTASTNGYMPLKC